MPVAEQLNRVPHPEYERKRGVRSRIRASSPTASVGVTSRSLAVSDRRLSFHDGVETTVADSSWVGSRE
ncbi:hypothetical protein CYV19_08415 [Natronobacterium gregoryi SP2]|uniref:Uncharacterized protein n=1 Tax=Natronobacterium gregoryi (strain ATCC 43098 / DSM 3393 / CCM 3738 / CIP 104747 / IAM 13177 / JCM 8860 / NBRC 102187 / NCIMB 2189 / SP2) TaxID=797304 RepID=L9Y5Q6_NATGS|nr:hypothetical protein C490_08651 [Natronobacterium gregoryi SP2]PLK20618.1 hypothetical protein CYV19_08415 [Natronobacterium gregoryi SP2]